MGRGDAPRERWERRLLCARHRRRLPPGGRRCAHSLLGPRPPSLHTRSPSSRVFFTKPPGRPQPKGILPTWAPAVALQGPTGTGPGLAHAASVSKAWRWTHGEGGALGVLRALPLAVACHHGAQQGVRGPGTGKRGQEAKGVADLR